MGVAKVNPTMRKTLYPAQKAAIVLELLREEDTLPQDSGPARDPPFCCTSGKPRRGKSATICLPMTRLTTSAHAEQIGK